MPTTPTYGLPYPALSDAPNGPSQIQALATEVEVELTRVDAVKPIGHGTTAGKKMYGAAYAVTIDASGFGSVTHGAGFTPTWVVVTGKSNASGAPTSDPWQVVTYSYTATTFGIRVLNSVGSAGPVDDSFTLCALMGT